MLFSTLAFPNQDIITTITLATTTAAHFQGGADTDVTTILMVLCPFHPMDLLDHSQVLSLLLRMPRHPKVNMALLRRQAILGHFHPLLDHQNILIQKVTFLLLGAVLPQALVKAPLGLLPLGAVLPQDLTTAPLVTVEEVAHLLVGTSRF